MDSPAHVFRTADGDVMLKCPTEVAISERRESELASLGFLPLSHFKNTDYAVFFSSQTIKRPKIHGSSDATDNHAIAARLPFVLAAGRFIHYLMVMTRDLKGSIRNTEEIADSLTRWLQNYCNENLGMGLTCERGIRSSRDSLTSKRRLTRRGPLTPSSTCVPGCQTSN